MTLETYKDLRKNGVQSLILNATNSCNLRCYYCFTTPNEKHMSLETAKQAILWGMKDKKGGEPLKISWFGGEPMLRFNQLIVPTMAWAREQGLDVEWGMTTNLTLLSQENLDILKEYKVYLLLSIDGPKVIQDINRPTAIGGSSWEKLEDNLPKILNYPYKDIFRSTVTPESAIQLFEVYKFAKSSGIFGWYAGPDFGNKGWTDEVRDRLEQEIFYITMDIYEDISNG